MKRGGFTAENAENAEKKRQREDKERKDRKGRGKRRRGPECARPQAAKTRQALPGCALALSGLCSLLSSLCALGVLCGESAWGPFPKSGRDAGWRVDW
jgi:hypothetical protein